MILDGCTQLNKQFSGGDSVMARTNSNQDVKVVIGGVDPKTPKAIEDALKNESIIEGVDAIQKALDMRAKLESLSEGHEKLQQAVELIINDIKAISVTLGNMKEELEKRKKTVVSKEVKSEVEIVTGKEVDKKVKQTKKVEINGVQVTIKVYDTYVTIGDHKRKIYKNKKGRYFVYGPKTFYFTNDGKLIV